MRPAWCRPRRPDERARHARTEAAWFPTREALLKQNLISQADYDQARADFRQQEAADEDQGGLAPKREGRSLRARKIYSPIDGIVISRDIRRPDRAGEFTAPELFKIAQDLRQMQITADISEADIGDVEAGQP